MQAKFIAKLGNIQGDGREFAVHLAQVPIWSLNFLLHYFFFSALEYHITNKLYFIFKSMLLVQ